MQKSTTRSQWFRIAFFALIFLLFFQLVPDFIESVYTFGLMGTDIPPQIISILFFFSPCLLLLFPRLISDRTMYLLAALSALARAVEVAAGPSGKMLASGFGVGCLFLLLPAICFHLSSSDDHDKLSDLKVGLLISVTMVILLRSLGAGSDISLTYPWVSLMLALFLLGISVVLWRASEGKHVRQVEKFSGNILVLSVGVTGCLMVLYFAFISPTVLARWSELDYRFIVGWLVLSLAVYLWLMSQNLLERLPILWVWLWNGIFIVSGVIALLIYQEPFSLESGAYPFYQREIQLWQHIPFVIFIALCPIVLHNFHLFVKEITKTKPLPRALGGGFLLGAFFFLIVMLAQVFTTVYDYIPVVGPWFRDRFWLVFLLAGLGMGLPIFVVKGEANREHDMQMPPLLTPILITMLAISLIWVVFSQPTPDTIEKKPTITVLTYNIQQGYSPAGERNYEEQMALIRSLSPDIIGLQESDTARFSGGNADIVRTFSQGLGMYAYYGPRTVTGTFGIALLSLYPIENPRTFFMYSLGEQTASIEATITIKDKKYHILVTHLGNDGPIIQQENILKQLEGKQNVIAMGDFNFEPTTEQYRLTTQSFADAWVLTGSPLPPTLQAEKLIDHFFVSTEIPVLSVEYIDSPVSDHPAVVMEVAK
ncbi:MAG: endonuclease/exonuclease/phosphatase family protein [Anaerolineales bacterium]|nr:endonuclease/exonuclease/phosphatase family protein [Anaerolineales bacterium]